MKIHKEGYSTILKFTLLFAAISIATCCLLPQWVSMIMISVSVVFIGFCIRFFRVPKRRSHDLDNSVIYAPADGTIVAIEEVYEDEYLNEKRIQISVFMSIWNVHVNWFPCGGVVEYFRHHHGKFLVAWHPKSSTENERTTTVVDTGEHRVLFRQIAGYVARRIINYADKHTGDSFSQSQQCGFIKFGSRVDVLIPLDSSVNVKLNDKVTGTQTVLATLPRKQINEADL